MDRTILDIISRIAPSAGKAVSEYFSKRKDISSEEIQLILLSKVLENETQVLFNQERLIDTQNKLTSLQNDVVDIITNHIDHEMKMLEELSINISKSSQTLDEACSTLRNMRAELIRGGVSK